jgi:hypothetical protein
MPETHPSSTETPPAEEAGAPPHAERPDAADHTSSPPRRRLLRAGRLAALVAVIAVAGAGCKYSVFGPTTSQTAGLQTAANQAAATQAAAAPASVAAAPPGTPPLEHWYALAHCETGSNWANPGPTFVGGLGMWAANWAAYGGLQYAPSADLATPEQQIAVATNLWLDGGSWGCRVGDGWDHR